MKELKLCVSYSTVINLLNRLGENHDAEVLEWSDSLQKVILQYSH